MNALREALVVPDDDSSTSSTPPPTSTMNDVNGNETEEGDGVKARPSTAVTLGDRLKQAPDYEALREAHGKSKLFETVFE